MPSSPADRAKLSLDMRVTARHLFEHALAEASIDRAFQRHVDCDRGVLRICEDLHDLDSYNRVLVISIGKAAHAMVNSLEMQAGNRFEGIVASSFDPPSQVRGFRYFRGGHPLPNQESIRAAEAMLKSLNAQNASSLVIFMLSGGGSSIAEKPIDDEISLHRSDRHLPGAGALRRTHCRDQYHSQASFRHQGWKDGGRCRRRPAGIVDGLRCPRRYPQRAGLGPDHAGFHHASKTATPSPRNTGCWSSFRLRCVSCFNSTRSKKPQIRRSGFSPCALVALTVECFIARCGRSRGPAPRFQRRNRQQLRRLGLCSCRGLSSRTLAAVASEVRTRLPAFRWRSHGEGGEWRYRRPQPAVCPGLCDEDFR